MNDSLISMVLQKFRGSPPGMTPPSAGGSSPFLQNPNLEQLAMASGNQIQPEPIIQQLMKHFGLLNLIRNQTNQKVIDPSQMLGT